MVCTLNVGITLNFQLAIILSAGWVFLTNIQDDIAVLGLIHRIFKHVQRAKL